MTAHTGPFLFLCIAFGATLGCGGSKLEAKTSAPLDVADEPPDAMQSSYAAPLESVSVPITQLERKDVLATIDAGLGRFLQKFEMEPSLTVGGGFAGFRIVRVLDPEAFRGLGIGAGDVITSINQHPIERPTEAFEAFIGLRTAPSLEVDYLRGGRPMRLSLPIVGAGAPATQATSDVAPAASAADAQVKQESGKARTQKAAPSKK
jgi:hypothetical protein